MKQKTWMERMEEYNGDESWIRPVSKPAKGEEESDNSFLAGVCVLLFGVIVILAIYAAVVGR